MEKKGEIPLIAFKIASVSHLSLLLETLGSTPGYLALEE